MNEAFEQWFAETYPEARNKLPEAEYETIYWAAKAGYLAGSRRQAHHDVMEHAVQQIKSKCSIAGEVGHQIYHLAEKIERGLKGENP